MRQNTYKKSQYDSWFLQKVVGASIILILILMITIMNTMHESEQIYLEGIAKSIPFCFSVLKLTFPFQWLKSTPLYKTFFFFFITPYQT